MAAYSKLPTTLSTKGQMILPKAVRERRGWGPGVRLLVEDRPEGVVITNEAEEPARPPTTVEQVRGMLKYDGPPITIEEMDEAVLREAGRRWELFERTGSDYEEADDDDLER